MQVKHQKSHVNVSDGVQSKGFGIVFDRHMVNILSNQLYQDKVLAIVRELSTNAYDSHVENGNSETPFDVKLPSWDNCEFVIRDYGTGMSPEKVDSIYRHYGATNRNQSNDFTGCMGLGSKSPFCYYTKTFTVETWYDGIHYTYACYLNEDGMPQISELSKTESNEPTGVKITIPCQHYDRSKFYHAAKKLYPYFKTLPNITGIDHNSKISKKVYDIEHENGWKYCFNDKNTTLKIIMGNVAYPVDHTQFIDTKSIYRILDSGIDVYVDIGEVDVTSSRESLEYTNRTKVHIRKYLNDIVKDINNEISKDLSKTCKSLWEARLRFFGKFYGIFKLSDFNTIYFKDQSLFNKNAVNDGIQLNDFIRDDKIEANVISCSNGNNQVKRKPLSPAVRSTLSLRSGNVLLYENDLKVGAYSRSGCVSKDNDNCNVLLIKFKDPKHIKEVCDRLGCKYEDFNKISSIPSQTVSRTRKSNSITRIVKFKNDRCHHPKSYFWDNCEVDINDGGCYVEFNRFDYSPFSHKKPHFNPRRLRSLCNSLSNIGIQIPTIYGVKTKDIDKFDKMDNWLLFGKFVHNKLQEIVNNHDIDLIQKVDKALSNFRSNHYNRIRLNMGSLIKLGLEYCNSNTDFYKFAEICNELKIKKDGFDGSILKNCNIIVSLCNEFNIKIKSSHCRVPDINKMVNDIDKKYVLLGYLHSQGFSNGEFMNHVGKYINSLG